MSNQEIKALQQELATMLNFTDHLESDGAFLTPSWVSGFKVTAEEEQVIFLGVPSFKTGQGIVLVFKNSGGVWVARDTITPMQPTPGGYFGNSLSVSDDASMLLVGAEMASCTFIFKKMEDGCWVEEAKLHVLDVNPRDAFGNTVAISKSKGEPIVLVGAPYTTVNGLQDAGVVYSFTREYGGPWKLLGRVCHNSPEVGMKFGSSVKYSWDLPGWCIQSTHGIHHMTYRKGEWEEAYVTKTTSRVSPTLIEKMESDPVYLEQKIREHQQEIRRLQQLLGQKSV